MFFAKIDCFLGSIFLQNTRKGSLCLTSDVETKWDAQIRVDEGAE